MVKTRTLYSVMEFTNNPTTAKKDFRKRRIKGAKIISVKVKGKMVEVFFIKTR